MIVTQGSLQGRSSGYSVPRLVAVLESFRKSLNISPSSPSVIPSLTYGITSQGQNITVQKVAIPRRFAAALLQKYEDFIIPSLK